MTEDERLLAHARDLLQTAVNDCYMTHTAFLDLHQQSVLQVLRRETGRDADLFFSGGYPDAERSVALFVPRYYEAKSVDDLFDTHPELRPFSLLRFEKDRFSTLTHRDYLGALMGLGIKRELLGDILVDEAGAFLVCLESVQDFLLEQLNSAGHASIKGRKADFCEFSQPEEQFAEQFASVASLRLDCVLGAAFSLSRTKAAQIIESGSVFLNSVQTFKADVHVSEGDKLVIRGKGKAVFFELRGESKKGRVQIVLRRYP